MEAEQVVEEEIGDQNLEVGVLCPQSDLGAEFNSESFKSYFVIEVSRFPSHFGINDNLSFCIINL